MFTNSFFKLNIINQRGISLIELIMFIVIVSTALVGIMSVMNTVTKGSADPMVHKQTLAIAESLLEEIEAQDFVMESGVTATSGTSTASARRDGYHVIADYHNFGAGVTGITALSGSAVAGLEAYNALVAVENQALDNISAQSAVKITVTVTPPTGDTISVVGYRTAY